MYFQYWIILHHTTQKSSPVAPLIYGLFSYIWGIAPPKHYPNSYIRGIEQLPAASAPLASLERHSRNSLRCSFMFRPLCGSIPSYPRTERGLRDFYPVVLFQLFMPNKKANMMCRHSFDACNIKIQV